MDVEWTMSANPGGSVKVTFGLAAHSGWAALVVLGKRSGELLVVDRRRIELVEDAWGKAPYHAAEDMKPEAARRLVERGVDGARRTAVLEIQAAVERERERGNTVAACAVLVASPLPDWSTDEILAVHFRMHKAEGFLFRDALARAAEACALRLVAIPHKDLTAHAKRAFAAPTSVQNQLARLGRAIGPPWGKDQKEAALAAAIALGE
jgi:hypothetical protein